VVQAAGEGGSERGEGVGRRAPRVLDVMRRDFITVPADESLLEALRIMQLARLRHLLVVGDGRLVGVLSYRDLQERALARAEQALGSGWRDALEQRPVRDAMVADPYFVEPETPADEAALRMAGLRVGCLPVCEREGDALHLVGILAESDLLRAVWQR
jgi:CBS domain-containing protein